MKDRKTQRGFALQVALLIVLVILPLALGFVWWMRVHYMHNTNTKLDAKLYYQNKSAVDKARYEIIANNLNLGGNVWSNANNAAFTLKIDNETSIAVTVKHLGFDPLKPDLADVSN